MKNTIMHKSKSSKAQKLLLILLALCMAAGLFSGCAKRGGGVTTGQIGVVKDEEFGNTYIEPSIDEFNELGFAFGDSVDIAFDNGQTYKDIPYYSGYYVPVGEMLLCGYPGYPHPVIARNYGSGTWEEFGMEDSSKVTVTLNQRPNT